MDKDFELALADIATFCQSDTIANLCMKILRTEFHSGWHFCLELDGAALCKEEGDPEWCRCLNKD